MTTLQLKHVPALTDSLADCAVCFTQIGVLLWQDGRPFVQECPACGALIKASRETAGEFTDVETQFAGWQEWQLKDALKNTLVVHTTNTQDEDSLSDEDVLRAMFGDEA